MNAFTVDTKAKATMTSAYGDAESMPSPDSGGPPRTGIARLAAWLRASVWTGILFRVVFFAGGLLLLAWVGRVATAATPPSPQAVAVADAGPAPTAMQEAVVTQAVAPVVTTPAASAAPLPSSTHSRATADDPVYLNRADVSELRRLPGVGPKRAEAIVALRQRVGRFQRAEDLLRVKGVGRATLKKWRPLLRLDLPTSPALPDGGAQL